jgi:hypothetical protein
MSRRCRLDDGFAPRGNVTTAAYSICVRFTGCGADKLDAHGGGNTSLGTDACRMVALGCRTFTRWRSGLEKSVANLKKLVRELGFSILGGLADS